MHILLAIMFFLIMEALDITFSVRKRKSDQRRPANEMEYMKTWANIYGDDWMFKRPILLPEPIKKESWYRNKALKHPDKDRKWLEEIYPYDYSRAVYPNREVWNDYWIQETGLQDYDIKYPWLYYPSDRDDYGYKKKSHDN